jgi:hypothetical protein
MEATTNTDEYNELARLRDELKLKMHLAKMEAQEAFSGLETRYAELELQLTRIKNASTDTADQVKRKSDALITELVEGYRRIRANL